MLNSRLVASTWQFSTHENILVLCMRFMMDSKQNGNLGKNEIQHICNIGWHAHVSSFLVPRWWDFGTPRMNLVGTYGGECLFTISRLPR